MSLLAINLDDGQTDAAMSLMPFGSLFSGSGVLTAASLAVAAQISPDMTVKVSGSANNDKLIIITSTGATYFIKNTAVENVTILANASGVTKTDAIVVYVDLNDGDPYTAGSPGAVHVIAVRRAGVSTGAPTNGEIDAATFNNPWFKLAQVVVTNGASSITSGNITDVRLACWLLPQFFGTDHVPGTALDTGTLPLDRLADEEWEDWTPAIAAQSPMTTSALAVTKARYRRIGNTVFFNILASLTTGGSASNYINIPMPVDRAGNAPFEYAGAASVVDSSVGAGFCLWSDASQSTIRLYKNDSSNFGIGTNRIMRIQGSYEAEP
jgi:hypothetical protein